MIRNVKRICVIGLDGVGSSSVKNFLSMLALNNIYNVVSKGYTSSFISLPPYTPSAWTSIFTGVNPGKHDVYGFFKVFRIGGKFKVSLASSHDIAYPRIFEMLSMYNFRSVVINIPLVYPVQGLVGLRNFVVVSDWASPRQFIYPKQYEDTFREYLVEPPHRWGEAVNVESYVRSVEAFLERRLGLYYELLEKENYNLFIIVFSELDWLMHRIPDIVAGRRSNLVYKVLSLIDKFVGRACEVCDLVVLVSDHGFTVSRLFIGVNSILTSKGLITFNYRLNIGKLLRRTRSREQGTNLPIEKSKRGSNRLPDQALRNLFTVLSMVAKKFMSQYALSRLESIVPVSTEVDYSSSKAFMLEPASWGLYVKEGYIDVVKRIFGSNRFVKRVLHKEEVFWGPYVQDAPDLILIPRDHVFFDSRIHAEPVYLGYVGEHEPRAIIAFYGDDVLSSASTDSSAKVSIYDLTPTVLAYMGLPIPSDTDGGPLTEIFSIELPSAKRKADYLQRFRMLRKLQKIRLS